MSNIQKIDQAQAIVKTAEQSFNQLARIHGAVTFEREASFAMDLLKNSPYLTDAAMSDQDSFKRAIINVASIGLSLSPVHKLAYLIPRKKRGGGIAVCLDISYRGYVQLAAEVGAIKWVHAEVVYDKDEFKLLGRGQEPYHVFDPFATDRGNPKGAYCVAKTHDGDFLTTVMTLSDLASIRDRSESWQAYVKDNSKSTPWKTDESEMIKKTVIRRAYKTWPMVDTRYKRFDEAINVGNEVDPIDLGQKVALQPGVASSLAERQRALLAELGKEESKYLVHLARVCRREIGSLEEMTEKEATASVTMLSQMLDAQNAQELKNENAG